MFKENAKGTKILAAIMAIICILALLPQGKAEAATDYSIIRVNLADLTDATQTIEVNGNYRIAEWNEGTLARCKYTVQSAGGQMFVTDPSGATIVAGAASVTFIQRKASDNTNWITVKTKSYSRNYMGDMLFTPTASGMTVINRLYLEDYLMGVVPYEMSNDESWPDEALRSQSVLARTFAIRQINQKAAYDVKDNTEDQVYKGYNASYTRTNKAVADTEKQVLTCDGEPVAAYYSASNGGFTEIPQHRWNATKAREPYEVLRVDPYDLRNPKSLSDVIVFPKTVVAGSMPTKADEYLRFLAFQMLNRDQYKNQGIAVASIDDVSISGISAFVPSTLRTSLHGTTISSMRTCPNHGANKYVPVDGAIDACQCYSGFNVTMTVNAKMADGSFMPQTITVELFGTQLDPGMPYATYTIRSLGLHTVEDTGAEFRLYHRRFGHAIGMSQRGAQQQAIEGRTYGQILDLYYPYTELSTLSIARPELENADGSPVNASTIDVGSEYPVMQVGDSFTIAYTAQPSNAKVYFTSSNSHATVSDSGKVTAKSKGPCTITVSSADGAIQKLIYVSVLSGPIKYKAKSISLKNNKFVTVGLGATKTVKPVFNPSKATNKCTFYLSEDPSIARVSASGRITGVSPGTTIVRVYSGELKKFVRCYVTVAETKKVTPLKSFKLNRSKIVLPIGKTAKPKVTFSPVKASNKVVWWTSSNPSVATVDENGRITALKKGTTTITALANGNGKKATVKITVVKESVNAKSKSSGVQVRSSASTKSSAIGRLSKNSTVKVTKKNYKTGWHQVSYSGRLGYVSSKYLKF